MGQQNNPSTSTVAPPPVPQAKAGRETCIVGCKLPHGLLIDLRANDGKTVRVKLNGGAVPVQATPRRKMPSHQIADGVGLTTVDKELFEAWLKGHQNYDPVSRGFIFMAAKADSVVAEAKDKAKVKTGFEPLPADGKGQVKRFSKED